jgi:hypothetical protein
MYKPQSSITKYLRYLQIGLVFLCIGLSACQQILDRLEVDLKGVKPTTRVSTGSQVDNTSEATSQPQQSTKYRQSIEGTKFPFQTPKSVVKPGDVPSQLIITKSKDHNQASSSVETIYLDQTEQQSQKPSSFGESKNISAQQVRSFDENGNQLSDSIGAKNSPRPRLFIED